MRGRAKTKSRILTRLSTGQPATDPLLRIRSLSSWPLVLRPREPRNDMTPATDVPAGPAAHDARGTLALQPTRDELKQRIADELRARDAVLVAHYYVDGDLQDLALETGGCVADSLEMARFGRDHAAKTLIVARVRFMGETAKILSPDKPVLMPPLDATCPLYLGCPPDALAALCDAHPERTVVVYA